MPITRDDRSPNAGKGYFYALAGTFLVSTNFVTAKYALESLEPVSFSIAWTAMATFYSVVITLATGRAKQVRLPRGDRGRVWLMGAVTGLGMIWGWTALSLLDPSFNAFLHRFAPMLTVLLGAVFLRERLTGREIAAMVLMICGGAMSTLGSWRIVSTGVIFALLGLSTTALQHFIAKGRATSVHPVILVLYRSGLACAVILAWGMLRGGLSFRAETRYWLVIALGALLGPCLSHMLTFRSLKYLDLSRASMLSNVQPLFVLPMAWLFLGRLPAADQLAGGLVIMAGASWLFLIHQGARRQAGNSVPGT